MDSTILDRNSLKIIQRWNLDNLEYVLGTVSNQTIKQHPMWYYLVPYDGLMEVLASLVMVDDPVDVGYRLLEIDTSENPLKLYRQLILDAKNTGQDNVILMKYMKWAVAEQLLSQNVYIIRPTNELKIEFFSDRLALKNIYGDDWRKYYRPRGIVA